MAGGNYVCRVLLLETLQREWWWWWNIIITKQNYMRAKLCTFSVILTNILCQRAAYSTPSPVDIYADVSVWTVCFLCSTCDNITTQGVCEGDSLSTQGLTWTKIEYNLLYIPYSEWMTCQISANWACYRAYIQFTFISKNVTCLSM